jgi:hypothetical protein
MHLGYVISHEGECERLPYIACIGADPDIYDLTVHPPDLDDATLLSQACRTNSSLLGYISTSIPMTNLLHHQQ